MPTAERTRALVHAAPAPGVLTTERRLLCALVTLNLADIAVTLAILAAHPWAIEANPVMAPLVESSPVAAVLLKLLVPGAVLVLGWNRPTTSPLLRALPIVTVGYFAVVSWNLTVLVG